MIKELDTVVLDVDLPEYHLTAYILSCFKEVAPFFLSRTQVILRRNIATHNSYP
jgi:hypothetical protein